MIIIDFFILNRINVELENENYSCRCGICRAGSVKNLTDSVTLIHRI